MTDANTHYRVPREMALLRDMLDKAGVEYRTEDYESPVPRAARRMEYHTTSTDWDTLGGETVVGFSAILTPFSYGSEYGLLEVWTRDTQGPEGWLSAEEAMELLMKAGLA